MDPITQGLLGAAAAQVVFARKLPRSAWFVGMLGGMTADLDVFIRSSTDPLMGMMLHRHFTHALAFIPIGGLLSALPLLAFPAWRKSPWHVIGAATVGYATHGLLDACTSYGTVLFWPFSNARSSWDFISIIDPIFTLALLVGVVVAAWSRTARPAVIGLTVAMLYMGFGAFQHHRAVQAQRQLAAERGHTIERSRAMPTFANVLVWRSVYATADHLHADALRVPLVGPPTYRSGGSTSRLQASDLRHATPTLLRDVERFRWFADDYLAPVPGYPEIIGDMRYSARTEGFEPFWGLSRLPHDDLPDATAVVGLRIDRADRIALLWSDIRGVSPDFQPLPLSTATTLGVTGK